MAQVSSRANKSTSTFSTYTQTLGQGCLKETALMKAKKIIILFLQMPLFPWLCSGFLGVLPHIKRSQSNPWLSSFSKHQKQLKKQGAQCAKQTCSSLALQPRTDWGLSPFATLFHHLCSWGHLSLTAQYLVVTPAAALRASHACGCFLEALLDRGAAGHMVVSTH